MIASALGSPELKCTWSQMMFSDERFDFDPQIAMPNEVVMAEGCEI